MMLAACSNWAEIFFYATTCRQVPFSAVVISLMGDSSIQVMPQMLLPTSALLSLQKWQHKKFSTSFMMKRKQHGNICPYRDLSHRFRDARRRSRRDCMVVMPQMIGARVPLGEQLISCKIYGRIGIANAAAVSDAKTNGYFCRFSVNGNKMKGMFHQFDPKMRERLLTVTIEDVPATISTNRDDLDKQREAKRKKEEMIEKKSLEKAKEDLIEASYY
jgi:hypothetical protein